MQKHVKESLEIIDNNYHYTFKAKDGNIYGIRLVKPYSTDAEMIKEIFKDVYGWNYLYPYVYDIEELNRRFLQPDDLWFMIEDIHEKEGVVVGLFKRKNDFTIYMSRLSVKKKFHGLGLSSILGGYIINYLIKNHETNSILRFDCEGRANNIYSQKFLEKTKAKPHGFILNYINYSDKRINNISKGVPSINGELEPVIMYAIHLSNFWNVRTKEITLLDNDNILYHYHIARSLNHQMKKDNLILEKKNNVNDEIFTILKDFHNGAVKIEGCLREHTLKKILYNYSNWNVIEWRIPANKSGLTSQRIALNNNFIVSGYDPGSLFLSQLEDTVILCNYPRGIKINQFENLDLIANNKLIVDKIISNIKEKKIKKITQ